MAYASCYPISMNTLENEDDYNLIRFNLVTSLLLTLNGNYKDDTYFSLAKYFLENLDRLDTMNIYDVADQCFVSRSSIQRFCKYLGFDSFTMMKQQAPASIRHSSTFITFASNQDFETSFRNDMNAMLADVEHMADQQNLSTLADLIYRSRNVVLVYAVTSNSGVREFQEEMIVTGKLIRIVSDATANMQLLEELDENDLLITTSATGNFALAIVDNLKAVKAHKVLVTLNRSSVLKNAYQKVYYLTETEVYSDHITAHGDRNVYTKYAMTCFLDLLYHLYVTKYQKENTD